MTQVNTQLSTVRPAATGSIMGFTGEVDKMDVVAIAVIKFEEQLEKAKARVIKAISAAHENIKTDEEQEIIQNLKRIGFGAYEVHTELQQIDENKQNVQVVISIDTKGSSSGSYHYSSHTLSKTITLPFTAEIKGVLKTLKAERKLVTDLTDQMAQIHKKLSSIPALERKARAKIAEDALSQSEEGKALLKSMFDVSDGAMPQFLQLTAG